MPMGGATAQRYESQVFGPECEAISQSAATFREGLCGRCFRQRNDHAPTEQRRQSKAPAKRSYSLRGLNPKTVAKWREPPRLRYFPLLPLVWGALEKSVSVAAYLSGNPGAAGRAVATDSSSTSAAAIVAAPLTRALGEEPVPTIVTTASATAQATIA